MQILAFTAINIEPTALTTITQYLYSLVILIDSKANQMIRIRRPFFFFFFNVHKVRLSKYVSFGISS